MLFDEFHDSFHPNVCNRFLNFVGRFIDILYFLEGQCFNGVENVVIYFLAALDFRVGWLLPRSPS